VCVNSRVCTCVCKFLNVHEFKENLSYILKFLLEVNFVFSKHNFFKRVLRVKQLTAVTVF